MGVPAIVLAAGSSRRLGQPKQLVCVNGETLLARTVRIAREAGADPILVVLGADSARMIAALNRADIHFVENPLWPNGIASSIHAGILELVAISPNVAAAIMLVCDQPRLTAEHLKNVIAGYGESSERNETGPAAVASSYAGVLGIPAVFPRSFFPRLMELTGDTGARRVLENAKGEVTGVLFSGGEIDVDIPDDLTKLQNAEVER